MKPAVKKGIIAAVIVVVLAAIGTAGVLVYPQFQQTQTKNTLNLEKFGMTIMPGGEYRTSIGELGATQLPATFAEDKLTPEEKVVASLIRDRNALLDENSRLSAQIGMLETRVEELEGYKARNEQYAPETFNEELRSVLNEMQATLKRMPEAEQFSPLIIELMAIAAQQEYVHIVRTNDLILDEARKQIIVKRYLPSYSLCVGNALSVAANGSAELQAIKNWIVDPARQQLPEALAQDLDVLLPPCQLSFRSALQNTLSGAIRG